jgi:hypothetical protein
LQPDWIQFLNRNSFRAGGKQATRILAIATADRFHSDGANSAGA